MTTDRESYPAGTPVKLTLTVRNVGLDSCGLHGDLGNCAASISVRDQKGRLVFGHRADQACPMYDFVRSLAPGTSATQLATWDAGAGSGPAPPGHYTASGSWKVAATTVSAAPASFEVS